MKAWRRARNQRGVLIMWLALFLLLLIGFVSLGIDMAKYAATRAQLQTAADAAALAGASAVDPDAPRPMIVLAEARVRAQATALKNKAFQLTPTPVVVPDADIVLLNDSTLQVTARREGGTGMVTHFAAAFLGPAFHLLDMKAVAVAEVRYPNTMDCGILPMGVVQPPSGGFEVGCNHEYPLKNGPPSPGGNYGFVDFPTCDQGVCAGMGETGKATVRCLIANGYCCGIEIGQVLNTEPGVASGPFQQAIQDRWDNDTDRREGICYSEYTGNKQRLIVVPITTPFENGRTTVTVLGFAEFFLHERPGVGLTSTMTGEFVQDAHPGSGSGGTGTVATVHLVR